MAGGKTWGNTGLLSSTLEKFVSNTFQEQIFTSKPLLWTLEKAGRLINADGGVSIVEHLLHKEAANVGSYADYDIFPTDPNDGFTVAEFDWKQLYGLFHISGIEMKKNQGQAALIGLMEARAIQVRESMSEDLARQLFGDGTGNSNKDFDGIASIVSDANPASGNFGKIDRTGNDWWKANVKDATATDLYDSMRTSYNDASEGNDHPEALFTTQTVFESYEGGLVDQARYSNMEMVDAGFQNLMFKGAPITFDAYADIAAGSVATAVDPIWFLNLKYISLRKLAEVWFTPQDTLQPSNQDAFYKSILSYGNLTSNRPNRQAVLYNCGAVTTP